jgi:hypothetical protein
MFLVLFQLSTLPARDDKVWLKRRLCRIGSTTLVCPRFCPDHETVWVAFPRPLFLSPSPKNASRRRIGAACRSSTAAIVPMPVPYASRSPSLAPRGIKWRFLPSLNGRCVPRIRFAPAASHERTLSARILHTGAMSACAHAQRPPAVAIVGAGLVKIAARGPCEIHLLWCRSRYSDSG